MKQLQQRLLTTCLLTLCLGLGTRFSIPHAAITPVPTVEQVDAQLWHVSGQTNQLLFDPSTLALTLQSGETQWRLSATGAGDLSLLHNGSPVTLNPTAAGAVEVSAYRTGYSAGVKVRLSQYSAGNEPLDLDLTLLITLEGTGEELVCEIIAPDNRDRIQELVWPGSLVPDDFDHTVVPFMQGMLLPKTWQHHVWLYDQLSFGRGLYMPWWGWQQGEAALWTMLETPNDAGCRFEHPAGGPTRCATRWVSELGNWAYPRRVRFSTIPQGDYVDMARAYRQKVLESGHFVSLREKIARSARVERMLGAPVVHTSILYHIQPDSSYYHKDNPELNDQLVTFQEREKQLEALAALGIDNAYVHLDGWGVRGYDNLHPDVLPPCEQAGGWEGMKALSETCERLGFTFAIHDQYRDYYLDAPSYQERHTVVDAAGNRSIHGVWYGGKQSILCSRFAPGYVRRNHQSLLAHGILLRGAYLDVFSVVPPDECFAPEHPVTRSQCLQFRGAALDSVRAWGGIVSSEEPSGWSIPHLDLVHHGPYPLDPNPGKGRAMGIPIPLFNLVYHDALLTPWSLGRGAWGIPENDLGRLHGIANAGLPYLGITPSEDELRQVREMMAVQKRLAFTPLLNHDFLDAAWRTQRFVYADGTEITIDLENDTYNIQWPDE